MNIILDVDGTIIDASDRMYILFNDIAPDFKFSKDEYWNLKRNKISHKLMFELAGKSNEFNLFNSMWKDRIETEKYLKFDKLYPDVNKYMKILSEKNNLILLTARQYEERFKQELSQFNLNQYFIKILVSREKNSKEDLLRKLILEYRIKNNTIYVSDMGQDISIGNKIGIKTIAVTHGFMSKERLIEYNPNYIVSDIGSVVEIIMRM